MNTGQINRCSPWNTWSLFYLAGWLFLAAYSVQGAPAETPSASPASGTYYGALGVILSTSTPGATIRFTTDGTDPTQSSPSYSAALLLTTDTVLKASAFADGFDPSGVLTEQYQIRQAPTSPVLWPVETGGNGHYYRLIYHSFPLTWLQAEQEAASMGGYLATLTSAEENAFVFSLVAMDPNAWNGSNGPYLGGYQPAGSTEPDGGWQWLNGDGPFIFTAWNSGEPNNEGDENVIHYYDGRPVWNDINNSANVVSFVAEFDQDPAKIYVASPGRDFSATNNPNGVWSYGYATTLGGPIILHQTPLEVDGLEGWETDLALNAPAILYNGTVEEISTGTITLKSGEVTLHPGPDNEPCLLRFTAPAAGRYEIVGGAYGRDHEGTTTDVHLLANGTSIFDGLVNGYGPDTGLTFDRVVRLDAGGTLDFAVGYGANGNFQNDTTAVMAYVFTTNPFPRLLVNPVTTNLVEGGSASLTVARDSVSAEPLTVTLSASVPAQLAVPATVTIPAGASSANVTISATQDLVPEAPHTYVVNASADGYANAAAAVTITDDDVPTLTLTLSSSQVSETAGRNALTATLTRSPVTAGPILVEFTSSDPSVATVEPSLNIPASQDSVQTPVAVIEDPTNSSGTRTAVLQARVRDLVTDDIIAESASVTLTVTGAVNSTLQVAVSPASVTEGQSAVGIVTRNAPLDQPLVVVLASDQTGAITLPATVTIPSGSASATFAVTTVNDDVLKPNRNVRILATAAGYASSSALLTVVDDDVPGFVLDLSAGSVVENAPNPAAQGTIVRTQSVTGQDVVYLLSSSNPQLIAVPAQVTMPVNQSLATFPITVIDNATVDGTRTVTITVQETEPVRHLPLPGQVAAETLTIYDDEGATLAVSFSADTVVTGRSLNGTVTRLRAASSDALTVQLTSRAPQTVSVPASVVIPGGAASANFTMQAAAGLTANQTVTIEANAAGYNPGSQTLTVTGGDQPDLLVNNVALSATQANGGDPFTVTYTVANDGTAPAAGSWSDYIYFSTTPQPDLSQAAAAAQITGPVASGEGYAQSVQVPLPTTPGRYWVVVKTDALDAVAEGSEANNVLVATQSVNVAAAYTATVSTSVNFGLSGTPIPLQGRAYNPTTNAPVANVPVTIRILSRDTRRVLTVFTDSAGNFSTVFQPLPTEAGTYVIGADDPGVMSDPNQGQFVLIGIGAQPGQIAANLTPGIPLMGTAQIVNHSDRVLSGVSATFQTAAPNVSAQVTVPGSIDANGQVDLSYTLTASSDLYTTVAGTFHVVTTDGAVADIPVEISVLDAGSQLVANPGVLARGMVRGTQATYDFEVSNLGATPTGPLEVLLPSYPWLSLVTPAPLDSLDPGQKVKITLLLSPAAGLPLQLSTGNIVVRGANASVSVPFQFTSISDAKGDLQVVVQDDYTFYAAGAPNVAGATVRLRDPYDQSIVVSETTTDANGVAAFSGLAEGPYTLEIFAPQHATYRATTILQPGITNQKTVFIPRQTVTYTWSVVPTEIPDEYDVHLLSTFETNVPVPVVTVEATPDDIPDLAPGESFQFTVKVVNHGLIAAQQAQLQVPGAEFGYIFTPLVSDLGDIPAQGELDIPVTATRPATSAVKAMTSARRFKTNDADGAGCSNPFVIVIHSYTCGNDRVWHQSGDLLKLAGTVNCPGGGGDIFAPVGTGSPEDPGPGVVFTPVEQNYSCDPCGSLLANALLNCVVGFVIPPPVGCISTTYHCVKDTISGSTPLEKAADCSSAPLDCFEEVAKLAGKEVPGLGLLLGLLDCGTDFTNAYLECKEKENGISPEKRIRTLSRMVKSASQNLAGSYSDAAVDVLATRLARLQAEIDLFDYVVPDEAWARSEDGSGVAQWIAAYVQAISEDSPGGRAITADERTDLLNLPLPSGVTSTQATTLLDRYSRSYGYWQQGYINSTDLPSNLNKDFIAYDILTQKAQAAQDAVNATYVEGFDDIPASIFDAAAKVRGSVPVNTTGVCARVRLQIDQQAVLTRKVFLGTLQLDNGSPTDEIDDVQVAVDIRDSQGISANDKFFVKGPDASGFTGADGQGTLAPGTTGSLAYTFVPTKEAAPSAPTVYSISGTLSFTQNGTQISIPLLASPVTVYPDAALKLRYFQQRAVYGDDPFTPEVEPAEPFAIGVMVTNTGAGTAHDFSITSAQPKIIDNEKGLLVDFKIIGTEIGSQSQEPSLTADLGDIAPGQTQVAEFLLTSTLQGKFIGYDASYEHSSALGGAATSLIDSIEIHELIHPVLADRPGDDFVPDFLANDVADVNSQPDTLYLSDGSVASVNLGTNPAVDAPASDSHLQVKLTAQMPGGWSYLELPDPGAEYVLTQVSRSDGKNILIGPNAWQTNRTFSNTLSGATTERLVHLFDYNGTGSYTLVYAPINSVPLPIDLGGDGSTSEGTMFVRAGALKTSTANPTWTATVDYGDGTGPQPLIVAADGTYRLVHVYGQNGSYVITLSASDGTRQGKAMLTVNVTDVDPTVAAGGNLSLNSGGGFCRTGSFSDPGTDTWTATVDYGDGTGPQPLTLQADKSFTIGKVYSAQQTYTVTVTVSDNGNGKGTGTFVVSAFDPTDTDGDGMPDAWELAHGLNPNDPSDAALDADGDGASNLDEYVAGTDPQDAKDVLLITSSPMSNGDLALSFPTVCGREYVVQYADNASANNWQDFTDVIEGDCEPAQVTVPAGTSTPERVYRVRVVVPSKPPGNEPPQIDAATATGQIGQPFSYQIVASDAPTSYGATGLPGGLSINPDSGLISGTPTNVGVFVVTLSATNAYGSGAGILTLTIGMNPTGYAPVITSVVSASAQVGISFSYQITASYGPTSFAAAGLPQGLSINGATGLISGAPTAAGAFNVALSAINSWGTGTATLALTVTANPVVLTPVITSATSARARVAQPFAYQIAASNAPGSYAAAGLPNGLSVDRASGLISGAPTAAGVYSIMLSAANAGGTGTSTLTLTVDAAPVVEVPVVRFKVPGADGGDSTQVREGANPIKIKVIRMGSDLSQPLTVYYKIKGPNVAGTDYNVLSGVVTIQAGATAAKIKVRAFDDGVADGDKMLKLKLQPAIDGSYQLGVPARAKILIIDAQGRE